MKEKILKWAGLGCTILGMVFTSVHNGIENKRVLEKLVDERMKK